MPANPACPFCSIISGAEADGVVYRDERIVAFLDRRPLFPGHLLVAPVEHVQTLGDLPAELLQQLMLVVQAASRAMESGLSAEGSFVAINNRVSQSVPHLHVHVVPRHKGDGLRGFFWPRTKYDSDAERDAMAARLARALAVELGSLTPNGGEDGPPEGPSQGRVATDE